MQHAENTFEGANSATIYHQCWLPEGQPHAVILISHGAAEHGGRYDRFAAHFTGLGYAVAVLDHYGHGRSDGGRCCLGSLDDLVQDLGQFCDVVEGTLPGIPQILLGHSLGGLVACLLLLQQQDRFAGCALSAPAIMTDLMPPRWQLFLVRLLSKLLPDLGLIQLDASGVSRDPAEVQRYLEDPLNHTGKLSARLVAEMFRGMETVQARAGEIQLPLLIMHGGADSMTAPAGSQFLHQHVASTSKQLTIYPAAYHEIFNEPEREQVLAQIDGWMDELLPAQGA
jgi:alpha-beta hydrolase superfamily lysophospholipase